MLCCAVLASLLCCPCVVLRLGCAVLPSCCTVLCCAVLTLGCPAFMPQRAHAVLPSSCAALLMGEEF